MSFSRITERSDKPDVQRHHASVLVCDAREEPHIWGLWAASASPGPRNYRLVFFFFYLVDSVVDVPLCFFMIIADIIRQAQFGEVCVFRYSS